VEKSEVLINIRVARRAHIIWVDSAKALVNGLDIKKEQIPINVILENGFIVMDRYFSLFLQNMLLKSWVINIESYMIRI